MSKLRFEVVTAAFGKNAVEVPDSNLRPSEYYGAKVFNREKMFKYLPKEVYNKLIDVIDNEELLTNRVREAILAKPMEHKFTCGYGASHGLNKIGG